MGDGLQDPDLSLDQLYDQAKEAMPEYAEFGESFLNYLQDKYPEQFDGATFDHAPLKLMERIEGKIAGDYGGDHSRVADMVRGRFLVETADQISIIRDEMKELTEQLGIVKFKDFYAVPFDTDFRTLNTQIRLPNGHVSEFRIDQIDLTIANKIGHDLYEEVQQIERQAAIEGRPLTEDEAIRRQGLLEQQRAILGEAVNKNNLNSLLNEDGVAKVEAFNESRLQGLADTFGDLGNKGGFVAGIAFGTLSGAFTLAAGGDGAQAATAVYEAAIPYGETQFDLAEGDLEAAQRSGTVETVSNIGAAGGAIMGATIGTAVLGPGLGTAAGAVVGGVAGGIASGEATEFVYDRADDIADWWDGSDDELLERLPTEIDDTAPPELLHLVEIKRMLVEAQAERAEHGTGRTRDREVLSDRREASAKIDRIEEMYDEAYETYEDGGQLGQAVAHLGIYEEAVKDTASLLERAQSGQGQNQPATNERDEASLVTEAMPSVINHSI